MFVHIFFKFDTRTLLKLLQGKNDILMKKFVLTTVSEN